MMMMILMMAMMMMTRDNDGIIDGEKLIENEPILARESAPQDVNSAQTATHFLRQSTRNNQMGAL